MRYLLSNHGKEATKKGDQYGPGYMGIKTCAQVSHPRFCVHIGLQVHVSSSTLLPHGHYLRVKDAGVHRTAR